MNRLAIVIPYYKKGFFEDTLKSVAFQTDKRFSLYIGNDASPDDPTELLNSCLKEITYEYFDFEYNIGGDNLALQWERILSNVKEEWFQILGDDDSISENFVEEFYGNLDDIEKLNCLIVRYTYFKIDEFGKVLKVFKNNYTTISSEQFLYDKLTWKTGSSLSENIFKTKLWQKYKFEKFPLAWHTDDYALLRLSEFGILYNIQNAFVKVRVSPQSITGQTELAHLKSIAANLFYEKLLLNKDDICNYDFYIFLIQNYMFTCRKASLYPNLSVFPKIFRPFRVEIAFKLIKAYLVVLWARITNLT